MKQKIIRFLTAATSFLALAAPVNATSVLQMSLEDLTMRAGTIFRGTVISIEAATIEVGGGELPAIKYTFEVTDLYKGNPTLVKGDIAVMEVTMLGSLKKPRVENGVVRLSGFRGGPKIADGGDYLLFVTPRSQIGLSMTVGLGQGAFKVYLLQGEWQAVNEFNNVGLGIDGAGPVEYVELSAKIRELLGQ